MTGEILFPRILLFQVQCFLKNDFPGLFQFFNLFESERKLHSNLVLLTTHTGNKNFNFYTGIKILSSLSRAGIDDGTSCSGTDFGTLDSRPGAQYQSHMDGYWE